MLPEDRRNLSAGLMLAVIAGSGALADSTPRRFGAEFQVNSLTTSYQDNASVAVDPESGEFVIVWTSAVSAGTDSSFSSIQGRRFSAAGAPLGAQFQVNSTTSNTQSSPRIALNETTGEFVVVWQSYGTDGAANSVRGRRFSAADVPLGSDFQVNSYTTDSQFRADVAFNSTTGAFVVVWQSYGSSGADDTSASVQGQRFAAGGAPVGSEFQVNTYTTYAQRQPAVAADPVSGNFVVVWHSYGSHGDDDSYSSVQARRYDAAGDPQGSEFQVNTFTRSYQGYPAVAVRPGSGTFVVTWQSYYYPLVAGLGADEDTYSIRARRFAADGTPAGAEFQVNTYSAGYQDDSAVAIDAATGEFFVVWESDGSAGNDSSLSSIQGQRFSAAGLALGGEFEVNTFTTSFQYYASIAAGSGGRFVVAWTSPGSSGNDGDGSSIQGQVFRAPLFADGFESGDTGGWL
jgi:hypothetical protein